LRGITACPVATVTNCCMSDVPCQYEPGDRGSNPGSRHYSNG